MLDSIVGEIIWASIIGAKATLADRSYALLGMPVPSTETAL